MGENSDKRYFVMKIWWTTSLYLPQIFEKLSNENLLKFPKAVSNREDNIWMKNIQYISICAERFKEMYFIASLPQYHYSHSGFHSQLTSLKLLLLFQKS